MDCGYHYGFYHYRRIAARRYFESSIQTGIPLHTVVEITMHGEFSLGDKSAPNYLPMKACQLLAPPFGFIWHVDAGQGLMQFTGSDAAFPGGSWTRFWLFGIVPVARVGGTTDHALSSFGRYMGESLFWSPASLLPSDKVTWTELDTSTARVTVVHDEFTQAFDITVDDNGYLDQVQFERWSNANSEKLYKLQPFGGYLSDFQEFDGFTLPTTVVAGNHFGTEDYFPFFKASVDSVNFIIMISFYQVDTRHLSDCQSGLIRKWAPGDKLQTLPSGISTQLSCVIGSDATTTARCSRSGS